MNACLREEIGKDLDIWGVLNKPKVWDYNGLEEFPSQICTPKALEKLSFMDGALESEFL